MGPYVPPNRNPVPKMENEKIERGKMEIMDSEEGKADIEKPEESQEDGV